jgi:hypothetical protein
MTNVTSAAPKVSPHVNVALTSAASGANALVAAVAGCKYRVLSAAIVTTLANSVKFQSAANDISALWPLGANGGIVLPFNEHGWFETNVNEALNINLSAATSTGVQIQYIRIFP